jgi:hypothetical protein
MLPLAVTAAAIAVPWSASAAVLYDQTSPAGTLDRNSNDYVSPSPPNNLDTQAADDFTVPPGQSWTISQADVIGRCSSCSGLASVVNLWLYGTAGTLPGAELHSQPNSPASNQPNYSIPVTGGPALSPGTYWLSVQQTSAQFQIPSWYWRSRTAQSGNPAAFRNPGGALDSQCTAWISMTDCFGPATDPDLLFKLSGTAASNPVTLGELKRNTKRGTAQLTVNVPGPGTLDVSGKGAGAQVATSKSIAQAGDVKVSLRAKGKAKKKLQSKGTAKLKLAITYTATGATPNSIPAKVKLRKKR